MIQLDLNDVMDNDYRNDEVIRAITTSMPHLQMLNLAYSTVSLEALEYLLPSDDNGQKGCHELVFLNLFGTDAITVEFLKKIIFCMPKLQILRHELMVAMLAEVTDHELGMNSGRCLEHLEIQEMRYNILHNAPIFALECNLTEVDIQIRLDTSNPVLDLLMPFKKLKSISLCGMVDSREGFISVLKSKGHLLEILDLQYVDKTITLCDIIRTCPKINKFTLIYLEPEEPSDFETDHAYQQGLQNYWSVLPFLREIVLENVSDDMCSSETLISLLLCPNLEKINFTSVQTMSDDVMFKVLSSSRASLSKVKSFTLHSCPAITAASFVQWFSSEKIVLEDLHITDCDMDDQDVLHAAVEKYPRQLNVKVRPVSLIEFPRYLGKAQGPCVENCHCCAYERRMCRKY